MMKIDVTKILARGSLRAGVVVAILAAAGCSDSAPLDKSDDPSLKSSMQKSLEIYKSKTQAAKGSKTATKNMVKRPS